MYVCPHEDLAPLMDMIADRRRENEIRQCSQGNIVCARYIDSIVAHCTISSLTGILTQTINKIKVKYTV